MEKWEYLSCSVCGITALLDGDVECNINDLGEDGWELVSLHENNSPWKPATFKRRKVRRPCSQAKDLANLHLCPSRLPTVEQARAYLAATRPCKEDTP